MSFPNRSEPLCRGLQFFIPENPKSEVGSVPRGLSITFFKSGKVFGSLVFVTEKALGLGHRFKARSVTAHPVGEIGYSTHGWRLAQTAA